MRQNVRASGYSAHLPQRLFYICFLVAGNLDICARCQHDAHECYFVLTLLKFMQLPMCGERSVMGAACSHKNTGVEVQDEP
jgi:hypothetical protein